MEHQTQDGSSSVAVLSNIFLDRRTHSGCYSLRKFSRDLGLSSGELSEILAGKRPLTKKKISGWAKGKNLDSHQINWLLKCVDKEQVNRKLEAKLKNKISKNTEELSLDQFARITSLLHHSIMALFGIKAFRSDPKWIALKLKAKVNDVERALDDLIEVGIIECREGRYTKSKKFYKAPSQNYSEILRSAQKENLNKAKLSIDERKPDERYLRYFTISVNKAKMKLARALIEEFQNYFGDAMGDDDDSDEVYNLAIQYYPLSDFEVE